MLGLRFFSLFTVLFLSLFIQKTCDVTSLLAGDETISSSEKKPVIQYSGAVKLLTKKKTQKTHFITSSSFMLRTLGELSSEKNLLLFSFLPRATFDNPSRAPPVV